MSDTQVTEDNNYLTQPIGRLFLTTALPIIMIMVVNGLFNLVDAYFLGIFVGAAALTAVTIMFPVQMLIYSLTTMIANGFASIVARRLGAKDMRGGCGKFRRRHHYGHRFERYYDDCVLAFWRSASLLGDQWG